MPLAVCATPIGNLEDVTLRVLRELAEADLVLCEDTRQTRILLERHGIQARLLSYHEHNEATRVEELLPRLEAGERIALVSDAGLPGVNDPGARLVRAAARCRGRRDRAARAFGGRDSPRRERPRRRAVPVHRLPAARPEGARGAVDGAGVVASTRPSRSSRRDACPRRSAASRQPSPSGRSRCAAS